MIYILLNIVPILVATFAGLAIGIAYYRLADPVAGRAIGTGTIATSLAGGFWLAAILAGALILAPNKASPWVMAIGSAVVIWIGFIVPAIAVAHAHRKLGARAVLVDIGYWLLVMVLQAIIMKAMGLVPPPA